MIIWETLENSISQIFVALSPILNRFLILLTFRNVTLDLRIVPSGRNIGKSSKKRVSQCLLWRSLIFCVVLASCTSRSNWELTSISTGQKSFDSSRLSYRPEDSFGMGLEIECANDIIHANLFSQTHRFSSNAKALIQFESDELEIPLAIHEGSMRAYLPDDAAARITSAFQKGQSITMIVDSQKQIFFAERFSDLYYQLTHKKKHILESFQGSLP